MPSQRQWLTFNKWCKVYGGFAACGPTRYLMGVGNIVSVEAFGTRYVILGSLKACTDLFDRRSSNFSDRPEIPMLNDLSGWGWNFAFRKYGAMWREERRTFHQYMNSTQIAQYRPVQLREVRCLVHRLLSRPDKYEDYVRHMLGATIMDVVYGIKVADHDDQYIKTAEKALETLARAGHPTAYLVNTFPWLKHVPSWLPGAQFKRQAEIWKRISDEFIMRPLEFVKKSMINGTARPSIALSLLEDLDGEAEKTRVARETIIRNVTAIAYAGGADTTVSAIYTFFLAMAKHPHVVHRAWQQLDEVLGDHRLPTFEDQERLPYITAICKEVMRWQSVAPLAAVHSSVDDDEYEGYFLPKGTIFFGNAWAILHDPEVYPEPDAFKPERFLKEDGSFDTTVQDPNVAAFGFGRRICPGRWFSGQSLFISVATVLSVFDIKAPVDETGKPTELKTDMTTGVLSYPEPFECRVVPRSDRARQLILEATSDTE
ncbi:cytochrome P450 [Punctularia strigosozonata HHB-11173 SS5]|uniref:cytochrome P450 n=1 Tax=Punctularia strigosozonata (strain HHB-11173) TaxID=741275 RepID=UPI0004416DD7|nr:cytochrome P450 [Punctularia strigosozonata HHB-11173 SS5]EIN06339.1 cytochrome P450 [Punctularia strigosozonata HHB-11173 SS5]